MRWPGPIKRGCQAAAGHWFDRDPVHGDDVEAMTFQGDQKIVRVQALSSRHLCTSPGRMCKVGLVTPLVV